MKCYYIFQRHSTKSIFYNFSLHNVCTIELCLVFWKRNFKDQWSKTSVWRNHYNLRTHDQGIDLTMNNSVSLWGHNQSIYYNTLLSNPVLPIFPWMQIRKKTAAETAATVSNQLQQSYLFPFHSFFTFFHFFGKSWFTIIAKVILQWTFIPLLWSWVTSD